MYLHILPCRKPTLSLVLLLATPRFLMVVRMCGGLDSEHVDVQMGSNLIAHTDTVSEQIKEREDQSNPEYKVLINKAVKILIQKQQCWAYECCVVEVHLAFGHVGNH